jgi:Flp pilus assembly pilin Flp
MPRHIHPAVAGDDNGATAVEYGLFVTAIAAVIVAVVMVIGHYVHGTYSTTCQAFSDNVVTASGDTCS